MRADPSLRFSPDPDPDVDEALGDDDSSFAYDGFGLSGKGRIWHDNSDDPYPRTNRKAQAWNKGDVIGVAVDLTDTWTIRFFKNGAGLGILHACLNTSRPLPWPPRNPGLPDRHSPRVPTGMRSTHPHKCQKTMVWKPGLRGGYGRENSVDTLHTQGGDYIWNTASWNYKAIQSVRITSTAGTHI